MFKYLGFGAPTSGSPGRRAAADANLQNITEADDVVGENNERDRLLELVEARDLIEFGMLSIKKICNWDLKNRIDFYISYNLIHLINTHSMSMIYDVCIFRIFQ